MQCLPLENLRFKEWLDSQNRSANSIAGTLGVSRAVLSHILSGRNKLSLGVVQSAARHYKDFDLYYVVLGEKHYKSQSYHLIATQSLVFASRVNSTLSNTARQLDQVTLVRNDHFRVVLA